MYSNIGFHIGALIPCRQHLLRKLHSNMDRIIDQHLSKGEPVEDLVFHQAGTAA